MSFAETDRINYVSARDSSHAELLAYSAKRTGRSPFQVQREFSRMAKSHGRINMVEYVRNGLYDLDRFSPEERAQFISNDLHWPIAHKCNDKTWIGAAEDKVLAGALLDASGVPVPESVAVLDRSSRIYPGLPKVASADALAEFLSAQLDGALFCKVMNGMVSFGAFRIEGMDGSQIICSGQPPMSLPTFLSDVVGDNSYLVQRELKNHSKFAAYSQALGTVRMVNMVRDTDVLCPVAIMKLPQGNNIADAFWRPGNLACEVDVESGRIRTIARRDVETEFLADHPEIPGLMGLELPFWASLREINERAARVFAPIRYQSTDIAITEDGPVVVEINYGGGFDLPQYASGRGLLTNEVREFFAACGVKLSTKRSRFFGGRR